MRFLFKFVTAFCKFRKGKDFHQYFFFLWEPFYLWKSCFFFVVQAFKKRLTIPSHSTNIHTRFNNSIDLGEFVAFSIFFFVWERLLLNRRRINRREDSSDKKQKLGGDHDDSHLFIFISSPLYNDIKCFDFSRCVEAFNHQKQCY